MQTIIEHLETKIPKGHWCDGCPYLDMKKLTMSANEAIQIWFCKLFEEYINRKECGINED